MARNPHFGKHMDHERLGGWNESKCRNRWRASAAGGESDCVALTFLTLLWLFTTQFFFCFRLPLCYLDAIWKMCSGIYRVFVCSSAGVEGIEIDNKRRLRRLRAIKTNLNGLIESHPMMYEKLFPLQSAEEMEIKLNRKTVFMLVESQHGADTKRLLMHSKLVYLFIIRSLSDFFLEMSWKESNQRWRLRCINQTGSFLCFEEFFFKSSTFFVVHHFITSKHFFLPLQTELQTSKAKRCRTTTWWVWTINHCSNWRRWCRHRRFSIQSIACTRCRTNIFATRTRQTFIIRTIRCASRELFERQRMHSSIKVTIG